RILIVDDEPAMHESYRQVFGARSGGNVSTLNAMAAELFGDDDDAASEPAPANDIIDFDCAHFNQGLDAVEAIKDSLETGKRF
ncbi:GGDEF domain-containing response regulator, partial [Escherichia coli]|nr:GGDEF domain-containing response regulator [Escherichia coli]